jgi:acetyltransferase-like isoleucine patch superfamily enzyme
MNPSKSQRLLFLIIPNFLLKRLLPHFKTYFFFKETSLTQTPIYFDLWYNQKIRGHCYSAYWPVHPTSLVGNPKNIYCGIETSPGYSPGCYIQSKGRVFIGDYTQIGPNVGIISSNHSIYDNSEHVISEVVIGKYCWIGMGSIILPGVVLGDFTIVGAGSIVTKSFKEGYCVIGGNPAKVIKRLDVESCKMHTSSFEYNGYIKNIDFQSYRTKHLNV